MRHVVNGTPVVLGAALVVPAGLIQQRRGDRPVAPTFAADAACRASARIERLADGRSAPLSRRREGCRVVDDLNAEVWMGRQHPTHQPSPPRNDEPRHIEVKGRAQGADTVTVSYKCRKFSTPSTRATSSS